MIRFNIHQAVERFFNWASQRLQIVPAPQSRQFR
jgi:hypothetical protein